MGGDGILIANVTLDNDDIIAASDNTTIELLPAVADKWYHLVGGACWSHIVVPYTNMAVLREVTIGYDNGNWDATKPLWHDQASPGPWSLLEEDRYAAILPGHAGVSDGQEGVSGKNLTLYIDNNNGDAFTGGDPANTLKFRFYYQLLEA